MNAVCVYVSTAQLVLQTESLSTGGEQRLVDLNRLLPHLRQLLSCAVCCRLLNDPFALRDGKCQHSVCRMCVRGQKSLRPICNTCKDCHDYKTYDENRQMRYLLRCYKSLCEHLMGTTLFSQLSRHKPHHYTTHAHPCIPLPNMSPQDFVIEGANYDDILSTLSIDLPRAPLPKLQISGGQILKQPTSVASSSVMHVVTDFQSTRKSITPPTSTLSSHNATSPTIKTEHFAVHTPANANKTTMPNTYPQTLTLKKVKNIVDFSKVHVPASTVENNSAGATSNPTIAYMTTNASGIVVPIVSSSATTSAPLTIASAKLQSLNRQLAHSRTSVNTTQHLTPIVTSTQAGDGHPPLTFKLSLAHAMSSKATATTTATVTSQIRNPPPIKTVSNGSAMYSVLYTGIGNKITIKRKTDNDDDSSHRKNASTSVATTTTPYRHAPKPNSKRRGCRCGNATPTPGKLTCCGQRCPCYVDSKSCIGCKCRGCRNPHRPDGGKVRPVIPELACYEIQMADENSSLSPNELPIATSTVTHAGMTTIKTENNLSQDKPVQLQQQSHTHSQHQPQQLENYDYVNTLTKLPQLNLAPAPSSSTTTLLPIRNLHQQQFMATATASQHQAQTLTTFSARSQTEVQQQQTHTHTHPSQNLLQHESVLIQNSEGKFQVVNVFTAGASQNQSANSISSLQRIHTLSQLQTSSCCNSSSNTVPTVSSTFLLPNATSSAVSTTTTSSNLPQLLIKQEQQQTHLQQAATTSSNNSMPIQLQQQLKQNNIITVHPLTASHSHNTSSQTIQSHMPFSSTVSTANTITLSPLIVTSPNTFNSDMFSDSSEEFISLKNSTNLMSASNTSTSHLVTVPVESPLSLSSNGGAALAATTHHLTPTMIEVIESNDLHLPEPDGFLSFAS